MRSIERSHGDPIYDIYEDDEIYKEICGDPIYDVYEENDFDNLVRAKIALNLVYAEDFKHNQARAIFVQKQFYEKFGSCKICVNSTCEDFVQNPIKVVTDTYFTLQHMKSDVGNHLIAFMVILHMLGSGWNILVGGRAVCSHVASLIGSFPKVYVLFKGWFTKFVVWYFSCGHGHVAEHPASKCMVA
ncbi:hypothetical protein DY000_02014665 [Brassica cretica]|uniref:Uncharacterized protein n=1 Tax=Brassica cretica TaxID=69181 RepID=A0ABQ7DCM8_BRACR|nr:hypothetical protein DY000_02014665 [Brassica cretica]